MRKSPKIGALILVYIFCWWRNSCFALPLEQGYQPLSMHGQTYPNACSPEEKSNLKATLLHSKAQDVQQAWRAIDTILCARDAPASRKSVKALVPQKVRKTLESTGDKPSFKLVLGSDDLVKEIMAVGAVWDVTISTEPSKLTVQYSADEACVKSTTLIYANSRWSIFEIGEACD